MLIVRSPARRRLWLLALFLTTTLCFVACRYSSFAVWNDSPDVFHPRDPDEGVQHWEEGSCYLRAHPLTALRSFTVQAFGSAENGGYRPLAGLWTNITGTLFYTPTALPLPLLLIVGALHGAFAVALFVVARRFVRSDLAALGAVGLVLASPPLVASSWVLVAGVQVLVPLLFCLSLLCQANLAAGKRPLLNGTVLVLLLILGPWVREYFGLNALLLIVLEWQRARRPTWLMGLASLGLLHFLFPTAIMHWLFFPDLPLKPVYQLGTLAERMEVSVIHWDAGWHFLPLMPPLLWVCGGVEALARLGRVGSGNADPQATLIDRLERALQNLAIPCWLILLAVVVMVPALQDYLGVVLCLGLAALGMSSNLALGCWFVLMFVPILRVYTEHVHFLYAMPPTAIILAQAAESLWRRLREQPRVAWMRHALAGVLIIIGLDQAMNVYGAYHVNHVTYQGIDAMADWFEHNIPRDAVVISNVLHAEEIKWHSGNHFHHYWSIGAGVSASERALEDPAQVEALLADRAHRPVYFLDVDFDYPPSKTWYHRNKYVHHMDVAKHDLGVVHITNPHYPFFDPLRYLIPRDYQPFLGAPDLVNDFGRGIASRLPFRHEVLACYHVYEVTGEHLEPRLEGPVRLERAGVEGFNILRVGLGFHAILQGDGDFDIERFRMHGYRVQLSGASLEAVEQQIVALRRNGYIFLPQSSP